MRPSAIENSFNIALAYVICFGKSAGFTFPETSKRNPMSTFCFLKSGSRKKIIYLKISKKELGSFQLRNYDLG